MESILKLTGLQKRHLINYDDIDLVTYPMDFNQANREIQLKRAESIQWIEMVMEEIRQEKNNE